MNQWELSPRLAALAQQVPQGAKLVDVGTDHAYLPTALLLSGRISGAVASDVNEGPLGRGRETARLCGVEEAISFRCCDGLSGVAPEEADTVVIAGMGGELIARILQAAPWTREALLLLQPMTAQPELRQWLIEHGYVIVREHIAREGRKFYTILTVRGGDSPLYTRAERWAGRQTPNEENPHRGAYLDDLIRRRERALAGMRQSTAPSPAMLAREEALLADLTALRKEWQTWQR